MRSDPTPVLATPDRSRTQSPERGGRASTPLPASQRVSLSSSDDEGGPEPTTGANEAETAHSPSSR
eukprot:6374523-Alexandrium_andersonii.AAC.1